MGLEEFISIASEYLNSYSLDTIIEDYLDSESSSIDSIALKSALPGILYDLYEFIITTNYFPKELKDDITKTTWSSNLVDKLLSIWTHGAISLSISFDACPSKLYRNVLIPLRATLADIMYAGLSTLRSDMSYPVLLESEEYSFLSRCECLGEEDSSFYASDYLAYNVFELKDLKLCYGYEEAWVFTITPLEIVLLDDVAAKKPMLVVDANGYGILEGILDELVLYLKDENAKTEGGIRIKDMMGMEYTDTDVEGLKEISDESFYILQYRYEADGAFDEDSLYKEENE